MAVKYMLSFPYCKFYIHKMDTVTLSEKVIKAAYEVHNELGTGFVEKVFENSMLIALRDLGVNVLAQAPLEVRFRGQIVGEYFADLLVENVFIVELKAVKRLEKEHTAQLINYLKAANIQNGLLINFAVPGLEIKRGFLPG